MCESDQPRIGPEGPPTMLIKSCRSGFSRESGLKALLLPGFEKRLLSDALIFD
jgi:hypothetical protein